MPADPQSPPAWDALWQRPRNRNFAIGPSFRHKLRILRSLTRAVGVRGRVVDVACGTGDLLEYLATISSDLTGVDLSATAIEVARVRCPSARLLPLDIEKGPLPETFDAVFCTNALEEMKEDGPALANMSAMLRPGGYLFLVVPHRMDYWTEVDDFAGNRRRYERQEMEGRLARTGLEVVRSVSWGWPLYRLWYRVMRSVRQDAVWSNAPMGLAARLVSKLVYVVLFLDDLFWNSPRGSFLAIAARKPC